MEGKTVFVLDPGHGQGYDRGADQGFVPETHVVDISVQYLAAALHAKGVPVVLTRDPGHRYRSGVENLSSRPAFAKAVQKVTGAKRVVFISVHADWAKRAGASGARVFTRRGLGEDHLSTKMAKAIQKSYSISAQPTQLKEANFVVLKEIAKREKKIQAVLVELGFTSNTTDVKNLLDKKAQERLEWSKRWMASLERYASLIQDRLKRPRFVFLCASLLNIFLYFQTVKWFLRRLLGKYIKF